MIRKMVVVCCDQMKEILPKTAIIITTVSCHLSGTSRVSRYQKKHSPNHHHDHHPIFISFFHLPRSIASSLFNYVLGNLFAQPLSFHVLFGLPLGLDSGALHLIFYTFLHPISVFHRFTDRQQEWHLTTHKFFVQSSLRSRGGATS